MESESLDVDASLLRASQQALLVHLDLASGHLADVSQMTDGELGSLVIVNKLVSFTERLLAACPQLSAEQSELREQPELPEQGSRSSQSKQVAEDEGVDLDASLLRASQQAVLVHLDLASKHLADVSQMTEGEVPLGCLVIVNKLVSWTELLLAACPQLSAGSCKDEI